MKIMHRNMLLALSAIVLQGCDNDNDFIAVQPSPPAAVAMASFEVTIANLTNAQPLSPVAIVGHTEAYSMFAVGTAASPGLEELAEGGDNSAFITEAAANTNAVLVTGSGAAAIAPAGRETISIEILASDLAQFRISAATMLVNTNDAFAALNGIDVSSMAIGEVMTFAAVAYDAGTESDTEAATDIPGPAGDGEGFNALRDDGADRVAMHAGIVSQNDGFATSNLTQQHRFDNPVMRISIARTQ